MSEEAQSNLQSAQPLAPSNTQDELDGSLPITYRPQFSTLLHPLPIVQSQPVSTQKSPLAPSNHQISVQTLPPAVSTQPIHLQDPSSTVHSYQPRIEESPTVHSPRVSIQEPPPDIHSSQVSIEEPSPTTHGRRVSIQEPPPATLGNQVSIHEPPPATHGRRVSIEEPLSTTHSRRVSIREPLPTTHGRRVSIQGHPPTAHSHRLSVQRPPPTVLSHQLSIQESPPDIHSCRLTVQELLPTTHSHQPNIQESPLTDHSHKLSLQESPPLNNTHSVCHISQSNICLTSTQTPSFTNKQTRPSVHVPPSITQSPTASIDSIESVNWNSQAIPKESELSSQLNQTSPDDALNFLSGSTTGIDSGIDSHRFQKSRSRQVRLPICWRLLHEARKISRQLSLVLNLAGLVIIGLISLGQPWMHFQVPLTPPGHPAGSPTVPINTILFVACSDISCLKEYDQYAYLLDLAWAFFFISSITSFCLCVALGLLIFFSSSKLPWLDFFLFIGSIVTGTSIALGVLFYLWQADRYLQEGMTYRLGISFYLAWIGIFLFLMTGFFSYLNYMNFWSILALQAVWT
ncbi:pollen-specific leucine-rich repeat extensin-like protein 1 [Heterocephalus glaber]|uniref:Pollen-specific leucine-rich repeat extensin-like protein 1 n=1 Tax=Heterocephalus glaber TaxID=10181 RepID=A0AAX6RZJ1_HETGA|nr:pollen-specific leucine-rich repeat extensin-like protein 1 [Heterocephalus glaber]